MDEARAPGRGRGASALGAGKRAGLLPARSQLVEARVQGVGQGAKGGEGRPFRLAALDAEDDSGRGSGGARELLLGEAAGQAQGAEALPDGGSGRCAP